MSECYVTSKSGSAFEVCVSGLYYGDITIECMSTVQAISTVQAMSPGQADMHEKKGKLSQQLVDSSFLVNGGLELWQIKDLVDGRFGLWRMGSCVLGSWVLSDGQLKLLGLLGAGYEIWVSRCKKEGQDVQVF